jgi:hypothetical protein
VKSFAPSTSIRSNTAYAIACLPASDVFAHRAGSDSSQARASAAVGTREGAGDRRLGLGVQPGHRRLQLREVAVLREPQRGALALSHDAGPGQDVGPVGLRP